MLVHQILKSKGIDSVITVEPGSSVADAARILSEKRIGTVVISTVDQMMTRNPHTCARDESADSVLERMTEGRFRHLPVVENGEMVGLITLGDVVKARLSELAMEKTALEGMIMGH